MKLEVWNNWMKQCMKELSRQEKQAAKPYIRPEEDNQA